MTCALMTRVYETSLVGDVDLHLFNEGTHTRLYDKLGAHVVERDGRRGTYFAVWAPDAVRVSVIGDFNHWDNTGSDLTAIGASGIWEGFIPDVGVGMNYKFHVWSRYDGYEVDKSDPFAFRAEEPPRTASIVWQDDFTWSDDQWMKTRARYNAHDAPISIYEVHLGSWRRPGHDDRFLTYREVAPLLADHVKRLGFTHVEFLPLTEHPYYPSWGYQTTGYFAPTSRFGSPSDFKYLIDVLHQAGIGVILDWVPSHFPTDEHGLNYFDGTHLYEHADPRLGFHPDWSSSIFNYGRNEVRSFLLSSACYWLDKFHVDGLRVDAVASMLYLDYSRKDGEWIPNEYGGRENLKAMEFLRQLNRVVYGRFPGVQTYAEESTAWPMVSRPVEIGGLGFGFKWDMGWMHDTLRYMARDPIHRKHHHSELTFRGLYVNHENFVMSLSHDEVVHGKGSLIGKMPGDGWQKFANLRLMYAAMFTQPGKKLLFMGCEFGQWAEWNHGQSLDWHLVEHPQHGGLMQLVGDLNRLYQEEPSMHELDTDADGFAWVDCSDADNSILVYERLDRQGEPIIVVLNYTPIVRQGYRIGVPAGGRWNERINTDADVYGGSGVGNGGGVDAEPIAMHGFEHSVALTLPPLAALILKAEDYQLASRSRSVEE